MISLAAGIINEMDVGALLNLVPWYYRWIALAALIGLSMAFGAVKMHSHDAKEYKKLEGRFDAFVGQVKAIGENAEKARLKDIADRKAISDQQEKKYGQSIAEIGAGYESYIASLRKPNPGSGQAQPLSSAAASLDCPNRSADIAKGLEQLESGILGLLKRGDLAIARTIACKGWIDEQVVK